MVFLAVLCWTNIPPTRPTKFGRGSCGILGTTCTSLPRTVPGSTRWSAGSPYYHNARSNEVRTTACVNWNLPSWSSSRCTTSSPNPLCGPRVPMPFSTALDGSLPVHWPHTAQTICKKSVTQETSDGFRYALAVSGFRFRARLGVTIPFALPGQRGITPAFGYSAPHSSARGTLTLLNNALLSAHYAIIGR